MRLGVNGVRVGPLYQSSGSQSTPISMKKTGTAVGKEVPGNELILCPACGNPQFERSLSEVGSIVQLAFKRGGKGGIKETIIQEGTTRFTYSCAKCATTLISDPAKL